MADRRRSGSHKHYGVYIDPELIERFKQAASDRGLTQSEAVEQAFLMWIEIEHDNSPAKDIHDLVARNLAKLQDCGVKALAAIAKGEALPTQSDFCTIAAALNLPNEEKKRLWKLAYEPKGDVTNASKPTGSPQRK